MRYVLFCLISVITTSCYQAYNNDDDLRTVPVTNNPNVVPNYDSAVPGMMTPPIR